MCGQAFTKSIDFVKIQEQLVFFDPVQSVSDAILEYIVWRIGVGLLLKLPNNGTH